MSRGALARHDLLTVAPRDWTTVAATRASSPRLSDEALALVASWGSAGRPVIARRPMPGDPPDALPVGLPLPPLVGKARVALTIPCEIEACPMGAVSLAAAWTSAPMAWHATIDATVSLGETLGIEPRVFGALLWQAVTGLPYLHAASDLDLLWPITDPVMVGPLLDHLLRLDAAAPMRLDGEVVTPLGGVNWRELAAARRGEGEVVLAKTLARAGFVAAADVLARLGSPCR